METTDPIRMLLEQTMERTTVADDAEFVQRCRAAAERHLPASTARAWFDSQRMLPPGSTEG